MTRRALIISNPGEEGEDDYLEGVNLDVSNYTRFLQSAVGGFWGTSRITHLYRPLTALVRQEVSRLRSSDYALVIFTGHGWYSARRQSTILTLNDKEEIDFEELANGPAKQTIILDCCRKISTRMVLDEAVRAQRAEASAAEIANPKRCRSIYKQAIEACAEELIIMYSCAEDEYSGDDNRKGGVYSFNLIKVADEWASEKEFDTDNSFWILTTVGAHNLAEPEVVRIRRGLQTPNIVKLRTRPYFPFCVMA